MDPGYLDYLEHSPVAGFGGMRDHDGSLRFAPRLPQRLSRLAFGVYVRGRRLKVEVEPQQARYSLRQGEPLASWLA
jgi:alpha,alpha-trehalose phosphorylase